ncbi:hypothetical protein ABIB66_003556 [Bradyrhizobium sp. F1.13.3]
MIGTYGLLFHAASEAMTIIAANPGRLGTRIRVTAVQHTSGSAMTHHPHIHMIVPGGIGGKFNNRRNMEKVNAVAALAALSRENRLYLGYLALSWHKRSIEPTFFLRCNGRTLPWRREARDESGISGSKKGSPVGL